METIISNPYFVAAVALFLLAYWRLSAKSTKLPRVPLGLFILYLVLILSSYVFAFYKMQDWVEQIDLIGIIVVYCAATRLAFYLLIDVWICRHKKIQIPKITRDVGLAVIFAAITIAILHLEGGFQLASLLTTSAVLTMVIGLALQDTLGNLFSGLALQTEKLFQIGEWISFKEHTGQVIGMTWKSTLIKTPDHEIVYIPNNVISKEVVKNYSRPEPTHVAYLEIGIEYNAPPNKVRKVILDALAGHQKVLKDPPPQVRLTSFGDSAITYQIRFWNDDFENEKALKAELMNMLWYALRRHNIVIPYPIRDVHFHHIDELREKGRQGFIRADIRTALKKVPILEPLSGEDAEILASRVTLELFGDKEVIVREGEAGESMYIIRSGACEVSLEGKGVVAILNEADFFGEMSLLTGEKRTATVRARGDTTVFKIDKGAFRLVLENHVAVSDALGQALLKRQAELAAKRGEKKETSASALSQLVSRIKSFFGIA